MFNHKFRLFHIRRFLFFSYASAPLSKKLYWSNSGSGKVFQKLFPPTQSPGKEKKNDKEIEGRGVERNRKEKVKTAVLLLNPKTISKFCFLRMPKIRQQMRWTKGSRPSWRPLATKLGLCALPSMGFAVNFRFLDQKAARFSATFPGGNGLSMKNVHLDLRINSCSQYYLNNQERTGRFCRLGL